MQTSRRAFLALIPATLAATAAASPNSPKAAPVLPVLPKFPDGTTHVYVKALEPLSIGDMAEIFPNGAACKARSGHRWSGVVSSVNRDGSLAWIQTSGYASISCYDPTGPRA